ncbi:response regulator [Pendulispora brunnea]|uniref:Response regulator n=1 Tax=Pendulispora brunnea TaxID=2905690 RepID=A0ABZ2K6K9_9BACT
MQKAHEVVSSSSGSGTAQHRKDTAYRRRAGKRLEGIRILVVDDERDSRLVLETCLRLRGAHVRTAASAGEGRRELEKFKPHVIVSDIAMPGEDGHQFVRGIRAMSVEHGGSTPAIALTAFADPEAQLEALEAGFNAHLGKPANYEELLSLLRRLAFAAGAG